MTMTEHDDQHAGHDDHDDHDNMGKYLIVFFCLLGLTALSFGTGYFFTGPNVTDPSARSVGWVVMLAVSCAKALLVMMFFMHLIWEANWKYVLTIPATVMSLLLLLLLVPDVAKRPETYSEERWRHAPEESLYGEGFDHAGEHEGAGDDHPGGH